MEMTNNGVFAIEPNEASFEERSDDNLAWLSLVESDASPPRYLMMTLSHDDQQLYLELNDQAWCCYDCLADTTFFRGGVLIHVKPEAAESLRNVERIAVSFKRLSKESVMKIRGLLATTFADAMQPIPTFSRE